MNTNYKKIYCNSFWMYIFVVFYHLYYIFELILSLQVFSIHDSELCGRTLCEDLSALVACLSSWMLFLPL